MATNYSTVKYSSILSLVDSAIAAELLTIDSDYIELHRPAEAIFNVVNNDATAYSFIGDGFSSTQDNPTLYLQRGLTYKFNIQAESHPLEIRVSDGDSAYSTGVINNAQNDGELIFNVPMDAPDTLVYQCTVHSGMVGNIVILSDTSSLDSAETIDLITSTIDSSYIDSKFNVADDSINSGNLFLYMLDSTRNPRDGVITSDKLFFKPSTGQLTATTYNSLSDITYKENIQNIDNVFDIINNIDAVEFNWKDTGKKSYGVIAQQIENTIPDLVTENKGIKTVQYTPLIAILIEAVKELKKQIDNK